MKFRIYNTAHRWPEDESVDPPCVGCRQEAATFHEPGYLDREITSWVIEIETLDALLALKAGIGHDLILRSPGHVWTKSGPELTPELQEILIYDGYLE